MGSIPGEGASCKNFRLFPVSTPIPNWHPERLEVHRLRTLLMVSTSRSVRKEKMLALSDLMNAGFGFAALDFQLVHIGDQPGEPGRVLFDAPEIKLIE